MYKRCPSLFSKVKCQCKLYACWMDSSVLSTEALHIQNDDHSGVSIMENNIIVHVVAHINIINIDATKRWTLDENECKSNHSRSVIEPFHDSKMCTGGARDRDSSTTNVAELECSGKAYMCGNCKMLLKPKEESDLEKQLNIQRIQHQIELEALQHEQRMKHLRTLLLS